MPCHDPEDTACRKAGQVPSQRIIKMKSGKTKLKLSLVNNTITAKVKDQKLGMQKICEALEKVAK